MRLLIVSHTPFYKNGKDIVGWGPTVREIDHLATIFEEVVHIAPLYQGSVPNSTISSAAHNLSYSFVRPVGGEHWIDKLGILTEVPNYCRVIQKELRKADFVHVRCPANISMVAIIMLMLIKKPCYRWVKYAGNWYPNEKDPLSYKIQRWILRNGFHGGTVSVNGDWQNQPDHVFSFYNPSFTKSEINEASQEAFSKTLRPPYRFLFVGRIEKAKGIDRILSLGAKLKQSGIPFFMDLVGDGLEREYFEKQTRAFGLSDCLKFYGWKTKKELREFYSKAHFMILLSNSEGWPKVLSEGMAYGAIPLASAVSSIPHIIKESGCGFSADPDDIDAFYWAIWKYVTSEPARWAVEKNAGLNFVVKFSFESYLQLIHDMALNAWGLSLNPSRQ